MNKYRKSTKKELCYLCNIMYFYKFIYSHMEYLFLTCLLYLYCVYFNNLYKIKSKFDFQTFINNTLFYTIYMELKN